MSSFEVQRSLSIAQKFWSLKSGIYPLMRQVPGVARILWEENRRVRALLAQAPVRAGSRVVDLGTGRGNCLGLLPAQCTRVHAVDYSMAMIHKARSTFPGTGFVNGDITALPFRKESFDLVTCIGLSEYIADFRLLIASIAEILVNKGCCVISVAPPTVMNFSRNLLGCRMYPVLPPEAEQIFQNYGLAVHDQSTTLLQEQYLLQKI